MAARLWRNHSAKQRRKWRNRDQGSIMWPASKKNNGDNQSAAKSEGKHQKINSENGNNSA